MSVPILPPRDKLWWSQNHDTADILHCNAVSRVEVLTKVYRGYLLIVGEYPAGVFGNVRYGPRYSTEHSGMVGR